MFRSSVRFILVTLVVGQLARAHDITSIAVYPSSIRLDTVRDAHDLIVIGTDAVGINIDVTAACTFSASDAIVSIDTRTLRPIANGSTIVSIAHPSGASATVELVVTNAEFQPPISWKRDIMPLFTMPGCNSGACHGSARGQDGFRLSLFGFDPDGDYDRLTREMGGRRLNLAVPEESLLLRKICGEAVHTGGTRLERDSPYYDTLKQWIAAGAPRDKGDLPTVISLSVHPPSAVVRSNGQSFQLAIVATYSDGTTRDVTDLAVYRTSNKSSVAVELGGRLTTASIGEAFITAAFDTHTVGTPLIVLAEDIGAERDPRPSSNDIDHLIDARLARLRITPSPPCSDEVFLRRLYLDMVGLLPTPEERTVFLVDTTPEKRAKLIDSLLERREFIDQWVMQWAELLQIRSNTEIPYKSTLLYFEWLRACFANDVPIDEMTRRILHASGGTFTTPETNFYINQSDAKILTESIAQAFMGTRIQCAQCHNHPFDRWTQDDYYGFVSFFTQVGRKKAEDLRETIIFNSRKGEVNHPVSGKPVPPTFLGGPSPETKGHDRRSLVAEWLTSRENPFFARSLANRIWATYLGVGIVHPVDDVRVSNPPTNEELLALIAERLVASGYDIKALVREICNTAAYQRSTVVNETNSEDLRNYSHAIVRRIRAETLLDIIAQVTNVPSKFRGLPLGARAAEIADGTTSTYFLTTFGRAKRDTVCACEVKQEPSLSQALHLLNGDTVHDRIENGNVVGILIDKGASDPEIVHAIYVACLGRAPTAAEFADVAEELAHAGEEARRDVLNDAFWSVLNANEFIFNH